MGSFANSVFNMLLGWIRAAASSLWGALTGRGEDFLTWIGENWLAVTIAICAVCTLIDVVVHFLRWRPHRVWASFFRRLRGAETFEEITPEVVEMHDEAALQHESEAAPAPAGNEAQQDQLVQTDEEAYRRRFARPAEDEPTKRQYRIPQAVDRLQFQPIEKQTRTQPVGLDDYPAPAAPQLREENPQPVGVKTDEKPTQPRVTKPRNVLRKMVKQLVPEDDNALLQNYQPARPFGDKKDMYHAPVYPPAWQHGQQEKQDDVPEYTPRRRRRRTYDADEGV